MEHHNEGIFLVYALILQKTNSNGIRPSKPLYFSNKEQAMVAVRQYADYFPFLYHGDDSEERVYCLIVECFALNLSYRLQLATWVFSPEATLLSECLVPDDGPFLGRANHTIEHRIGEIVEVPIGDQLVWGVVLEQPLCFHESNLKYGYTASDDCYTILCYPDHELHYAHAPFVFKPEIQPNSDIEATLRKAVTSFYTQ